MTWCNQPPRNNKPSIKYKYRSLDSASFELVDFDDEDIAPTSSGNGKQNGRKSESKSSEILSTAELISAVGQICDYASRPLAFLRPKTNWRHNDGEFQEGYIACYSDGKENGRPSTSTQNFPVNFIIAGHPSPMAHSNIEGLHVYKNIPFSEPHYGNFAHYPLWRFVKDSFHNPNESWKEKSHETVGVLSELRNIYGWMPTISLSGLQHQVNSTQIERKKTENSCLSEDSSSTRCLSLGDTDRPANNPTSTSADCQRTVAVDSSSGENTPVAKSSITSLCSDYSLEPLQVTEENSSISGTPIYRVPADDNTVYLGPDSRAYKESRHKNEEDCLYESKMNQQSVFDHEDLSKIEIASKTNHRLHYGLAKQEHAFAGALAGIIVSLCLHPVDTVKTVIQSCRADQRSIHYIGRSIISERGITGLYRGIASNIASSAPISAVYTFTYESVKGALHPLLTKEYQSFAHCMAGGSASIATSFIFTPSERIKQQMQVGTHYPNCWKAFAGIIMKGGLSSLYAGWGAVLCRNVPHSIIKFYTYESLKQLMLSSAGSNAQPSTLQTLLCGGLAGSTAALFTTPFDVVKTRLQTRIPGSVHQYDGVFDTLKEIGRTEGLKGLYRGLIPRLLMYVSQGAIFFASYESFKRLFASEVPHLYARTIEYKHNMEDEAP